VAASLVGQRLSPRKASVNQAQFALAA
jgi:hypothetical protein